MALVRIFPARLSRGARGEQAAGLSAGGPFDPGRQMGEKERLAVALRRVPEGGVERSTPLVRLVPSNRVISTHFAVARRIAALVEREEHLDVIARVGGEGVPLVRPP